MTEGEVGDYGGFKSGSTWWEAAGLLSKVLKFNPSRSFLSFLADEDLRGRNVLQFLLVIAT